MALAPWGERFKGVSLISAYSSFFWGGGPLESGPRFVSQILSRSIKIIIYLFDQIMTAPAQKCALPGMPDGQSMPVQGNVLLHLYACQGLIFPLPPFGETCTKHRYLFTLLWQTTKLLLCYPHIDITVAGNFPIQWLWLFYSFKWVKSYFSVELRSKHWFALALSLTNSPSTLCTPWIQHHHEREEGLLLAIPFREDVWSTSFIESIWNSQMVNMRDARNTKKQINTNLNEKSFFGFVGVWKLDIVNQCRHTESVWSVLFTVYVQ